MPVRAVIKDLSADLNSVLVHFGADKARFHPMHLRVNRSIITVPSAWHFKPLTEVSVKLQLPPGHKSKRALKAVECRGIIVECRPWKQKGRYHVDLVLADLPTRHEPLFKRPRSNGRAAA